MKNWLRYLWFHLRTNRASAVGFAIVGIELIFVAFAEVIAPYSPTQVFAAAALTPPSAVHWLGTDVSGMDIFSRIVYGARVDLLIAVLGVGSAFLLGVPIGIIAAYYRNVATELLMRLLDFLQSFPIFVLAMALVVATGQNIANVAVIMTILFLPIFARLTRAEVLSLRERPFAKAALCAGASNTSIMFRHLLPNAVSPALVQVSVNIGWAILLTAGLSFVGAGVRMPTAEWGLMVSNGSQHMVLGYWWVSLFPGIAISVATLGFALFADSLRDLTDPTRRR